MKVTNRLRVLRAEQDWTQAVVAERLGVSRQAINAVENGKYDPSVSLALALAQLFGTPVEQIFKLEPADAASGASGELDRT
jgi:putative transcriptional regulator